MSIKAPRGLFWVALMVVIVGALLLSVGVSSPTEAQTATDLPAPNPNLITVRATFLHADADDATSQPRVVDLSAAGYKPGDTLRITYDVPPPGFSYYGCQGPFVGADGVRLLGVFSSSSELLPPSARERVPGAIDAGQDVYVGPTYPNNELVDIPQDFQVTPPSGFLIEIPPSATHLFLGLADAYYRDNCGAGGNFGTGATFDIQRAPDTTAPAIDAHADVTEEAAGPDGATVNYTKPAAYDAVDGSVDVTCTPDSGSQFELDETTVTCTAQDAAGNQATPTTFTVKVQDTTAPSLTVPSDTIVVQATGPDGATVNFANDVSASDAVDSEPSIDCTPASGTTFALETTTVSCTAKDTSGNQSGPKTFDVKVQDTTAPVISGMPSDITEEATSSAGTVVNYTKPVANDAVDPSPVVTCSPAPGSTFPVGSTTVSCTAKDATGNESAPETFKVNVVEENVAYEWSGFLQPINTPTNMAPSPYTQSIFRIGSTVPVKFKLTGASAGITDGTFYLKYIRTGNGDGVGEVETVATATGSTGTQFRYDAAADQYVFNWSTKGITQAGNYEVRVYTDSNFTNLLGSQSIELK